MSKLIYITGLSGSGKTTIAENLQKLIPNSIVLDGDIIRNGISIDLGFDKDSKYENIRRNNELIKMLYNQGFIIIAAFMASIKEERDKIFDYCKDNLKIQLTTDIEICKSRDVKGLYALNPNNFSGVNFKYTGFDNPDITLDTSVLSIEECITIIYNKINEEDNKYKI